MRTTALGYLTVTGGLSFLEYHMSLLSTFKQDAIALGLSPDFEPAILRFRASAEELYRSCEQVLSPRLNGLMEDAATWRCTWDPDEKPKQWQRIVNQCKEIVACSL